MGGRRTLTHCPLCIGRQPARGLLIVALTVSLVSCEIEAKYEWGREGVDNGRRQAPQNVHAPFPPRLAQRVIYFVRNEINARRSGVASFMT